MIRFLIVLIAVLALTGALLWSTRSSWTTRGTGASEPEAPLEPKQPAPVTLAAPESAGGERRSTAVADTIEEGQSAVTEADGTLAAEPPARPVITLDGIVRDEGGAPLSDVELSVEAHRQDGWFRFGSTYSAEDGSFQLDSNLVARLRIRASIDGYVPRVHELGELPEGAAVRALVLVLERGRSIAGVVRGLHGGPAEAKLALVALEEEPRRGTPDVLTGASDESGAFAIGGLSAESYRVTARAREGNGVAELEQVMAGTRDLVLTLSAGLELEGKVIDERGIGVADFAIEGRRTDAPWSRDEELREFFRDTDGSFTVGGLLPGSWELHATSPKYAVSETLRLILPASAPVELVLQREASVTGRVVDPRGAPVAGASVRAGRRGDFPIFFSGDGYGTDEQGRFEIGRLARGPVVLLASGEGFAPNEALELELEAGETLSGITLRLRNGGTILGEVVGADGRPQGGQTISLFAGEWSGSTEADDDGRFRAIGVPAGEIDLLSETLDGVSLQGRVTLGEGETVHARLAPPSGLVRLHGMVSAGDEPFALAWVEADLAVDTGTTEPAPSAWIDEDGAYDLALAGPGRYQLTFSGGEPFLSWKTAVDVPAVDAFEFDVRIPVGRISGRVTDAAGRALPGMAVGASVEQPDGEGDGGAQAQTDVQGRYELLVPPGSYAVSAGGWQWSLRKEDEEGTPYAEARVGGLVVTENSHLLGVDLHLVEGGILEGIVRNQDGSPAPRAMLWLEGEGKRVMLGATEEDGGFRFPGVPAGTHLVNGIGRTGLVRERVRVEIVVGETRRIELALGGK